MVSIIRRKVSRKGEVGNNDNLLRSSFRCSLRYSLGTMQTLHTASSVSKVQSLSSLDPKYSIYSVANGHSDQIAKKILCLFGIAFSRLFLLPCLQLHRPWRLDLDHCPNPSLVGYRLRPFPGQLLSSRSTVSLVFLHVSILRHCPLNPHW